MYSLVVGGIVLVVVDTGGVVLPGGVVVVTKQITYILLPVCYSYLKTCCLNLLMAIQLRPCSAHRVRNVSRKHFILQQTHLKNNMFIIDCTLRGVSYFLMIFIPI